MATARTKLATAADLSALPGHVRAEIIGLGDVVRAEPFESAELRVSVLFGVEDEEE
jgi:hypothetical protein